MMVRLGVAGQASLDGGIGGGFDTDLGEHPFGVDFAGGLDDPGQDEVAKYVVTLGG